MFETITKHVRENSVVRFLLSHLIILLAALLICAVVAAIVALAVVGALKGQLKQAAQQSTAHSYIHDGSFYLDVNTDHFLYESTTRRKIENNEQRQ